MAMVFRFDTDFLCLLGGEIAIVLRIGTFDFANFGECFQVKLEKIKPSHGEDRAAMLHKRAPTTVGIRRVIVRGLLCAVPRVAKADVFILSITLLLPRF
jgi:hypothetical protein